MGKVRLTVVAILMAAAAAGAWWRPNAPGDADPSESPEQAEWRRFSERCASTSLKTLTAAENEYAEAAQDREWCHVNDFWTSNVQGLYTMTSVSGSSGEKDPAVRLIELSVASADDESDSSD